jgi:hypothetical protein
VCRTHGYVSKPTEKYRVGSQNPSKDPEKQSQPLAIIRSPVILRKVQKGLRQGSPRQAGMQPRKRRPVKHPPMPVWAKAAAQTPRTKGTAPLGSACWAGPISELCGVAECQVAQTSLLVSGRPGVLGCGGRGASPPPAGARSLHLPSTPSYGCSQQGTWQVIPGKPRRGQVQCPVPGSAVHTAST